MTSWSVSKLDDTWMDLNPFFSIYWPNAITHAVYWYIDNAVPLSGFFHDSGTGFGSPMRDLDEAFARLSNREAAALAEGPASRIPVATVMPEHPPTRAPTATKQQVSIQPNCPQKVFISMGCWVQEGFILVHCHTTEVCVSAWSVSLNGVICWKEKDRKHWNVCFEKTH